MTDTAPHPVDLEPIKARCEAATPGPWFCDGDMDSVWSDAHPHGHVVTDPEGQDGPFIAHARTDVPALVAEVELLRAALWRSPEDWLKGDDEAWFALTGERVNP